MDATNRPATDQELKASNAAQTSARMLLDAKISEFNAYAAIEAETGMTRTRDEAHALLDRLLDENHSGIRLFIMGVKR